MSSAAKPTTSSSGNAQKKNNFAKLSVPKKRGIAGKFFDETSPDEESDSDRGDDSKYTLVLYLVNIKGLGVTIPEPTLHHVSAFLH
jgi:hypothetical protein